MSLGPLGGGRARPVAASGSTRSPPGWCGRRGSRRILDEESREAQGGERAAAAGRPAGRHRRRAPLPRLRPGAYVTGQTLVVDGGVGAKFPLPHGGTLTRTLARAVPPRRGVRRARRACPYPRAKPGRPRPAAARHVVMARIPVGVRLELVGDAEAIEIAYRTETEELGYRGDGAGTAFAARARRRGRGRGEGVPRPGDGAVRARRARRRRPDQPIVVTSRRA